jgi:microcystin-dependent protein
MAVVSLLAQVADLKASQVAGAASSVMPSGVILPYGGATAPTGWLLCDGSTKSRTDYADLFAAIGTAHGSGDGSTTFHLPDLRGRFLRGVSGASTNDPDRTTRTAANTGGNTGNLVGSVQTTATKTPTTNFTVAAQSVTVTGNKNQMNGGTGGQSADHGHNQTGHAHNLTVPDGGASVNFGTGYTVGGPVERVSSAQVANILGVTANHTHSWDFGAATFTAAGTPAATTVNGGGDAESRPLNANVNYIIKV